MFGGENGKILMMRLDEIFMKFFMRRNFVIKCEERFRENVEVFRSMKIDAGWEILSGKKRKFKFIKENFEILVRI